MIPCGFWAMRLRVDRDETDRKIHAIQRHEFFPNLTPAWLHLRYIPPWGLSRRVTRSLSPGSLYRIFPSCGLRRSKYAKKMAMILKRDTMARRYVGGMVMYLKQVTSTLNLTTVSFLSE